MNRAQSHSEEFRYRTGVKFTGQSFSGITGAMAAALADQAAVCVLRYPAAATGKLLVDWIHLHYVTLIAYTTAVTAGRRLTLKRGSGDANASGGADLSIVRDQSDVSATEEPLCTGQIATTGALTTSGITFETATKARLLLVQAGAAGADYDEIWTFDDPLILLPGQCVGILAGQAFDAAGTWQLDFKGHCKELRA